MNTYHPLLYLCDRAKAGECTNEYCHCHKPHKRVTIHGKWCNSTQIYCDCVNKHQKCLPCKEEGE